jgi:hypothetical protein
MVFVPLIVLKGPVVSLRGLHCTILVEQEPFYVVRKSEGMW